MEHATAVNRRKPVGFSSSTGDNSPSPGNSPLSETQKLLTAAKNVPSLEISLATTVNRRRVAGFTSSAGDDTSPHNSNVLLTESQQLLLKKEPSPRSPQPRPTEFLQQLKKSGSPKTSPRDDTSPLGTARSSLHAFKSSGGASSDNLTRISTKSGIVSTGSAEFTNEQTMMSHLTKNAVIERQVLGIEEYTDHSTCFNPIRFVTENEATSICGSYACSGVNLTVRQIASVLISTYLRQVLAWSIQAATHDKPELRWVMAGVAVAYPVLLNSIGAVTDRCAGSKMEKVVENFCTEIEETILGATKKSDFSIDRSELKSLRWEMEKKIIEELNDNNEINSKIVETYCKKIEERQKNSPAEDQTTEQEDPYGLNDPMNLFAERTIEFEDTEEPDPVLVNQLFETMRQKIEEEITMLREELGDKYWDTPSSTLCRIFNVVVLTASAISAGYLGVLPNLAPTLVAFGLYCVLRDLVQLFLPLDDGIQKFYLAPTFGAAAVYGINQTGVNQLMTTFARFSGQSAFKLPYLEVVKSDFLRGIFNCLGEILDLLTLGKLQGIPAKKEQLIIKLQPTIPSLSQAWKTLTGTHTGRVSLFFSFLLIDAIIFSRFDPADLISNAFLAMLLTSGIDAAILMLGYVPFLALASRADWPYSSEAQTGGHLER